MDVFASIGAVPSPWNACGVYGTRLLLAQPFAREADDHEAQVYLAPELTDYVRTVSDSAGIAEEEVAAAGRSDSWTTNHGIFKAAVSMLKC